MNRCMLTKEGRGDQGKGDILQKIAICKKGGCRRFSTLDKIRIWVLFQIPF
jgi:hypothetical protein